MNQFPLDFAFAWGRPGARALFRAEPEDFRVDEELGFTPSGEGEHLFVKVRKRNQNTMWIARQLAQFCGVPKLDVGYCGLKDRHAVTTQWFSVRAPGVAEPDWSRFNVEGADLLAATRHNQKLRPGAHRANHFAIRLRAVSDTTEDRLARIPQGVPNYFGEQRFGIDGGNLVAAQELLVEGQTIRNRKQRGLIISAARAYLFNRVLSERIARDCWQQTLPGDVDSGPTGPLWGRGRPPVSGETLAMEEEVLENWRWWREGLEHVGLRQERRSLICRPREFSARLDRSDLLLAFALEPGQYATAVLREIVQLESPGNG